MGASVGFGFEVPGGSVAELEAAAQRASWASARFGSHAENVRAASGVANSRWSGRAQANFSGHAERLIGVFSSNSEVLGRAGLLVAGFAAELDRAQRVTQQALAECERCRQQAQAQQTLAEQHGRNAQDLQVRAAAAAHPQAHAELASRARAAEADGQGAAQAASRANSELADWQRRGQQALAAYTDVANETAGEISVLEEQLRPAAAPAGGAVLQTDNKSPSAASGSKALTAKDLEKKARFFRTPRGSTVAFAIAQRVASEACNAHHGDIVGPLYLCSPSQYATNIKRVYYALQHGQNLDKLHLIEPAFDTNPGLLDPVAFLAGLIVGGIESLGARALARVFDVLFVDDSAEQASIWSLGWQRRGLEAEKLIVPDPGARLPPAFPTIDAFGDDGIARSIKTVDLSAPTYERGGAVLSKLKGYINDLYDFRGARWSGADIRASQIRGKELDIGIPGTPTAAQADAIADALAYAGSKGIVVKVVVLP